MNQNKIIITVGVLASFGVYWMAMKKTTDILAPSPPPSLVSVSPRNEVSTEPRKKEPSLSTTVAEKNCITTEYEHEAKRKTQDIESFMDYSNAFPIEHSDFNPKTVCVKVTHQSVAFKISNFQSHAEIKVGSIIGPESVIEISYCTGKQSHKINCPTPKKDMMDDLMDDEDDSGILSAAVTNKVKELRSVASETDLQTASITIRNWHTLQTKNWNNQEKP